MGSDKAGLRLQGRSVLEGVLRVVLEVADEVVVMRAPEQSLPDLPVPLLDHVCVGHDSVSGEGPLQGIADALPLLCEGTELVYLLTCDLPYLTRDWLVTLRKSMTEKWDAVCTTYDGIANPLLALYRTPVLCNAYTLLKSGQRRPIALWEGWRVLRLQVPPESLTAVKDMNTPDEYRQAQAYFKDFHD